MQTRLECRLKVLNHHRNGPSLATVNLFHWYLQLTLFRNEICPQAMPPHQFFFLAAVRDLHWLFLCRYINLICVWQLRLMDFLPAISYPFEACSEHTQTRYIALHFSSYQGELSKPLLMLISLKVFFNPLYESSYKHTTIHSHTDEMYSPN